MKAKRTTTRNEITIPLQVDSEYLAIEAIQTPTRYLRIITRDQTELAYWPMRHFQNLPPDALMRVMRLGSQAAPYAAMPELEGRLRALIESYLPGIQAYDFETGDFVLETGQVLHHHQVESLRQALARMLDKTCEAVPDQSQRSADLCVEYLAQMQDLIDTFTRLHTARMHPQLHGFEEKWVQIRFVDGETALLYTIRTREPLPRHLGLTDHGWVFIAPSRPIESITVLG